MGKKKLKVILKKHSGRDNSGQISVRHQGGRHKRYYRIIDFKRDKRNILGKVVTIEYDPNRTVNIALIEYEDGEKKYILHPQGLNIGESIIAGDKVEIKVGNATKLRNIPLGTMVHNIELYPGQGGKLARSAGTYGEVVGKDEKYAHIKFPSREIRKVLLDCYATIGQLDNIDHKLKKLKKAGDSRHRGIRPTVRGTAQNPRSHPHGGGEGRTGEGMNPKTPWGKPARGKKTRKKGKWSDKLIIKRRK